MIRHIVLFKLKPFESAQTKADKLSEIKKGLEALPTIIPQLKLMQVGINMNSAEQYDLSLLTEFETMDDLQTYAVHPDHLAVSKIIREVLESRACMDSEF
ncbi:MAG: Dabb family protein [Paludibacteraceae bacterium]|nr:Dabb family protein [Paludibacteraceae bacterium]